MKLANAPEAKNQRRQRALLNLQRRTSTPKREQEAEALRGRIVASMRDVRTKKNRSGRARP